MLVVDHNNFSPYQKITKAKKETVIYPSLFSQTIVSSCKDKNKVIAVIVGLIQLTGKIFSTSFSTGAIAIIITKDIPSLNLSSGTVIIIGKDAKFDISSFISTFKDSCIVLYEENLLPYIFLSCSERVSLAKKIKESLSFIHKYPEWEQCIQKTDILGKFIGHGSYGNVYEGKMPLKDLGTIFYAIKLAKLKPETLSSPAYSKSISSWHEVLYLKEIINPILEKNICPNLPYLIDTFFCKKCNLTIEGKKITSPCVTSIVEYAEGNLKTYLNKYNPNIDELYSCLFQIMAGLSAIQKYGQIMNFDVKKENILFYNVNPGGYWQYNILDTIFYVPNYGKLFVLNDFGISRVMSPHFPFYKSQKDITHRLGSRYAVIKDGVFMPISTPKQVDANLEVVPSKLVKWLGIRNRTRGACFRMLKSEEIIPLEVKVKDDLYFYLKSKGITFLKGKENIIDTSHKDFYNPEIIPPFEFYNDTQDVIRMFTGGKRTTQRHNHSKVTVPKIFLEQLAPYQGEGENLDSGIFSTNPNQVLASYFIKDFFAMYSTVPKKDEIIATYKI